MSERIPISLWLVLLTSLLLSGCSPAYTEMAEKRLDFARTNQGYIEVVAIYDLIGSDFVKGVLLGADVINRRPEKLLGRLLKVNLEKDGQTFADVKTTIRRIAANPKITAVLGHRRSSISIPASVIYERSQIVFMPSFSTTTTLTGHNFDYVFRMVPSTKIMAEQLASVAKTLGFRKIIVLHARDDVSRELAFLFENAALKQDIHIIKRSSFFEKESNYRPIISQFSSEKFDGILISSPTDPAAVMVRQLREMGITQPVLGNDLFNNASYQKTAGKAAENTIIPSIYQSNGDNLANQKFIQQYRTKYKKDPDDNAALGYDSIMLLAAAIERAKSTLPPLLASTLHYMPAWVGVTGIHDHDQYGELQGKKYIFKVWKNDQLQNLPAIHVPYLVNRFEKGLKNRKVSSLQETTNFSKAFAERLHEDDYNIYLLDLAQEILNFKRIGIIYENTIEGRKEASYALLKALADRKELAIVDCEISFSVMDKIKVKQALTSCYGKLSLNVDALFIPPYHDIDNKLIQQLNSSLAFFKIPTISLDKRNTDPNISLLLGKRSDINLQAMSEMQVYNNLLNGLKVHEFAEYLKNLPEITVNLDNLQHFGLPDQPIIDISPDSFLYSDDTALSQTQTQL